MNQQEVDEIIEGLRIAQELLADVRYHFPNLEVRDQKATILKTQLRRGIAIAESKLLAALKPIDPLEREVSE